MGRIGYFVNADNAGASEDRAARPRPARARADVLLPRQPGDLLRRRAGLHRHRRRPGGAADHVRQPGAGVSGRRSARHHQHPRAGQLRPRPSAVHAGSGSWPRWPSNHPALRNGAHQHRYASTDGGHLRLLADPARPAARVRGRPEQQRAGTDRGHPDLRGATATSSAVYGGNRQVKRSEAAGACG